MSEGKSHARAKAMVRRGQAHQADLAQGGQAARAACANISKVLAKHFADLRNVSLAGYMPMRSEIDPRPAMRAHPGGVCVPVIAAPAQPLVFYPWSDDMPMVEGAFKALIPAQLGAAIVPDALIVPLVAFGRDGARLGYGGGFYDRTLQNLRSGARVLAIGVAYDAQHDPDLPQEATDQKLDYIVTPTEVIHL